ncbi:MAG: ATP-binding protein [Acidobacteriota bacterium]
MTRRAIGQRREFLILLPVALLVLVSLSTYALLSYRSAIDLLVEERRQQAEQKARSLASELVTAKVLPTAAELRRRLPGASRVEILSAEEESAANAASAGSAGLRFATFESPPVIGTARFKRSGETRTLRVEMPASVLRSRQRSLGILTPVMLTVNGAVTLLVLLFVRRFLAPFDRLVERARHAGQEVPDSQDEVVFLVETFEKALEALNRTEGGEARELDELKALEGTLTRSLESGVLLLDREGVVLALNDIGSALLEIDSSPVGRTLSDALQSHPKLEALLARAIRREQTVQREECALELSGSERTLGVTAHPLRRDEGDIRGFLVMFADLTEAQREIKEQQLGDSLAQLGELTAGVAHEMRNSLATLRGYLTLIDRSPDQESVRDYLGEIQHESDHLKRVLDDFLMFARPGSAQPRQLDLLQLVHRSAADPALAGGTVSVEAEDDSAIGFEVLGDPQLLERALRNVLANAVEAQREAGRASPVTARVVSRTADIEVIIEDRGAGLSPEVTERLFDPFFTQRAGGVGMGLALTRRIVLLHAGRIELENRQSGGTRARMWIPRSAKSAWQDCHQA